MLSIIVFIVMVLLPCSRGEIFGYVGKDHVVLSSCGGFAQGSTTLTQDYPWIRQCTESTILAAYGDSTDLEAMMTQIDVAQRQFDLKSNRDLSPQTIAHICRHYLLTSPSKTRRNMEVMLLIAGYDCKQDKCVLWYLDAYGGMKEVDYAAHGASLQAHLYSLLDQKHVQLTAKHPSQPTLKDGENTVSRMQTKKIKSALQQLSEVESEEFVTQCWQTLQRRSTQSLLTSIHTKIIRKPSTSTTS